MDKELRQEVKNLMKQGFPENIAIITACANQNKTELSHQYLAEIQEENEEIEMLVKHLIPLSEAIKLQQEEDMTLVSSKNEKLEICDLKSALSNESDNITITENVENFPVYDGRCIGANYNDSTFQNVEPK